MSKYKEIKTEFRDAESLLKALADLGIICEQAKNLKANSLEMVNTYYGTKTPVAIRLSTAEVKKPKKNDAYNFAWGELGFAWNGSTYDIVIDDTDEHGLKESMDRLRQRYAYQAVKTQAVRKGYTVREVAGTDGTIRLQLTHR